MTQLKHTIIYMIVFCLIFLGLSYLVSVNKELVFYSANSAWISNDFLLSCFTGIFASLMVLITTGYINSFKLKARWNSGFLCKWQLYMVNCILRRPIYETCYHQKKVYQQIYCIICQIQSNN